ncbi:PREDICTED: transcription termination factor MTEF18, mitochondrial-like isoform X2 [Camelina sativa]|uniref:Transcription termination factor MTEF18, mitochondrial-like isoform X1 n=1 Tax=Camelina sativa TaxID=90675 RepID=A0ABM0X6Y8_CAMSA|nr:PREDICTED: transcription termination factor MTEF18, mitochondrial-like isoform X1 [Camelina sativa]XP_010481647.1 PREDICTED: transcription termination factor MTEF18, mitochondrial-like isoform X2 [Camelina sativa]XP_010481648.1 PREDICTED: transcription termination factor MTEF18, mitochondrial-like isoform X1 [Camelina sativa]XP_010481649.1 PREDICTED: transcription termination factor MTEF18, mitochondrial-like isoform X2 [Camelina sativa]
MMFPRFLKNIERIAQFNAHKNQVSWSKLYNVYSTVRCYQNGRFVCSSRHWSQSPTRVFGNRVSKAMKNEAQKALFDYLHHTRTLSFVDAEHISKNSPSFVLSLLSKIDDTRKEDISRSLAKFFRYNPINEFEPFLESLGLRPSEISRFLQRDLVLLSDDGVMFVNFHVLCYYGIPRGKIGRMYKEAREIFGYENGVLASKLEAYESLVLSKTTVIKVVTCCPLLLVGGIDGEFVSVVNKLKGLNIGCDWLARCLSDRKTYNWRRILETMELLDKVGFKEEKLSSVLKAYPDLVSETSGNKAYIVFEKLHKVLGLEMNEIDKLVIDNPEMLLEKSVKRILEAMKFLRCIKMEKQFIVSFLLCHMKLICSSSLIGPRAVWNRSRIGRDELCHIIKGEPLELFSLACKINNSRIELVSLDSRNAEKMAFLLKLGYIENSDEMVRALKKFQGRGDELQERFDCFVKAGLDYNVVTQLVKRAPHILNRPKDIIEKKINMLTDYLGYPIESLIESPTYLSYSMERIHQRFSMYIWLRKRDAVIPRLTLGSIVGISNTLFVSYFVRTHPEGPATWENIKKASYLK